jgi:hypothetical protein
MAAITLISRELLVHTADTAVAHFLVILGHRRRLVFPLRVLHSGTCTHSSANYLVAKGDIEIAG